MGYSSRVMTDEDWDELHFFKREEFKYPDKMGYEFMVWLEKVRVLAKVPMVITSSYRAPEHNRKVGGAKNSAHMQVPCNTVDIGMRPREDDPNWNYSRFQIVFAAMKLGCKRVGSYQNGFLHIDRAESTHPAPRMWRVVVGR